MIQPRRRARERPPDVRRRRGAAFAAHDIGFPVEAIGDDDPTPLPIEAALDPVTRPDALPAGAQLASAGMSER